MVFAKDKPVKCESFFAVSADKFHDKFQQHKTLLDTIFLLRDKVFTLEQQLSQMQYYAYHDSLTGLPNRNLFTDRVNQAIKQASRHHTNVCLLLLDLNGFKAVNDTFGHDLGDNLLQIVATRLLEGIRADDSVYRYGGDEFIILLPTVDGLDGSLELMRKLHYHLAEPFILDDHSISITASIGQAVFPEDGLTLKELVSKADTSMYLAKSKKNLT